MDPRQDDIDARAVELRNALDPADPVLALPGLIAVIRQDADGIERRRRRGWQSDQKRYLGAIEILTSYVDTLNAASTPALRPPLDTIASPERTADLDPADGPVSGQIADRVLTGAPDVPQGFVTHDVARAIRMAPDTDAKLAIAFDLRHIGRSVPGPDGTLPDLTTWCGTQGVATNREMANCPQCITVYDATVSASIGHHPDASGVDVRVSDDVPDNALLVTNGTLEGSALVTNIDPLSIDVAEPAERPARMTWAQVREHAAGRRPRRSEKRSYSQVSSFEECPVRYALSDLDRTPCWWLVGGRALHFAMEAINQSTARTETVPLDTRTPDLWRGSLNRAIAGAMTESGMSDVTTWHAAGKGSEGYDWWRVNGAVMVDNWIRRLTRLHAAGWRVLVINGVPAVEWEITIDVDGVPLVQIIDLVMHNPATGELCVVDAKGGKSAPSDPRQPGQYAHAVARMLGVDEFVKISAAWWMARTDEIIMVDDPRGEVPWDDVVYETVTMDAAEKAGHFLPIRQYAYGGCRTCRVNALCPAGPR